MPKKLMALGLLPVMLSLLGCGGAPRLSSLESSKTAYMRCLEQNPDDPSRCDALRQAYEADMRVFQNTRRGLTRSGVLNPD
jgi:hypothetical protein